MKLFFFIFSFILNIAMAASLLALATSAHSKEASFRLPEFPTLYRPPYLWTDSCSGEKVGIFIDMLDAVFTELDINHTYVPAQIDLNTATTKDLEWQKTFIDGKVSYYRSDNEFMIFSQEKLIALNTDVFYLQDSTISIKRWKDMTGKRVAIAKSSYNATTVAFKSFSKDKLNVLIVSDFKQGVAMLKSRQVDYIIDESFSSRAMLRHLGEQNLITVTSLTPSTFKSLFLTINPKSKILKKTSVIDEAIRKIRKNGKEKLIYKSYMSNWLHSKECEK